MQSGIGKEQVSSGPTQSFDVDTEQAQAGGDPGQAQGTGSAADRAGPCPACSLASQVCTTPTIGSDGPGGLSPFLLQILVLGGLGLVALIPRIILANQLDLITDEIIYILAGKSYTPLLRHITTSPWSSADAWQINYEHPPLVKLLIGLSILVNDRVGHPFTELVAARIPSIITGTALIMVTYWLGRKPFGQVVAILAALSLAFSPWLVYFSSIAYLDMTMTTFITTAYLLTWHATRRPWLYPCVALSVALGIDSKYTAALVIPGILLFTAYTHLCSRGQASETNTDARSSVGTAGTRLSPVRAPTSALAAVRLVRRLRSPASRQRPSLPWLWWLVASVLAPLCFLIIDPVIWPSPLHLFKHSLLYEWDHSVGGHLTFLAGSYNLHVPPWAIPYIIVNKISAFVTVPATIFVVLALIRLIRFHLGRRQKAGERPGRHRAGQKLPKAGINPAPTTLVGSSSKDVEAGSWAFLFIWLVTMFGMFSLLNIVVGTHYLLPLAPPTVIAGTYTIVYLVRQGVRKTAYKAKKTIGDSKYLPLKVRAVLFLVIGVILVGPHLVGLLNTAEAEGYTSEFFRGEDQTLQVAYAGYREAVHWLDTHTQGEKRIGLVALPQTLWRGNPNVSWFAYNNNVAKRFHIQEAHPNDTAYPYDYLIWPMHLVQRGYSLPQSWHIIQRITGGDTTYCFIAASPSSP
jgi:Dolichyl-phosphate-mannose-protein mannosyltransferase